MKYYLGLALILILTFSNCNKDDEPIPEISIEEQNAQDDVAIQIFLNSYYFNDIGKLTAFDEDDPSDDNETPILNTAHLIGDGVYYVVNESVTAEGDHVTYDNIPNQDILIHYDFNVFNSAYNSETEEYSVSNYTLISSASTTTTTGLPQWNPAFYKVELPEDATYDADFYEMPGFREAIPHFNATNRDYSDPFIFQGAIIIPSRANYARNANFYGMRNNIAVINFELYKVQDSE